MPSGKSIVATFPIEVTFSNPSSSLKLPEFVVNGETFCENCSPSITFGATQPTATPTINETPTPTATTPVFNETATPTAMLMPGTARRVYLPLVMKRN